ncbi:glycosyltransferase [Helicobacter enhydrae]|uniref:Glycosyltransferase n=1 Tax=Helicobacter enhydrae TaxID=222136 RepID=A0A1B1U6L6_9HELI|nr:glycosyltransferase family 2 protein [Helicobacter enhydrae]ANV98437.1 glycosyltransferase [Helicobacter enhydrae]
MAIKISVTILAKNAQKTLKECLQSVKDFDEVILLDNQSTDKTQEIAKEFANVRIFESEFLGFGALKNLAISYARNDWILSLDSDEVLEDALIDTIKMLKLQKGQYYSFLRKNCYGREWIKGCGWHPDWVKRIFCKQEIKFKNDLVHEGLEIPKECVEVRLKQGGIRHYTTESIEMICAKMNRYTTLSAKKMCSNGKNGGIWRGVVRFVFVFIRDYCFRSGWKYGYKGFIIAWFNASGSMLKYMKTYEMKRNED